MRNIMDRQKLIESQKWFKEELERCTAFWLSHGIDKKYGGVYTCLDRKGEIYSTDKSVWMQGRCGWVFAFLCNTYGKKQEWLDASKSCIDFMEKYCINKNAGGRMYFTVTEDGKPLRQRRYCFSEAFYAMANAEYYKATGEKEYLERAKRAYDLYWNLNHGMEDPTGLGAKSERDGRAFGIPMIYLNVSSVMLSADPENADLYNERSKSCVDDIFTYFVKPELNCVLENVATDGTPRLYYTEGRTVNPGHDIEGVWFLLDYAERTGETQYIEKAEQIFNNAFSAGWDKEYGGLLYFIDCKGLPPEAYEHDMKLWWPHNEILISTIMLYRFTKKEEYLDKFYMTLDYCQKHFSDPEYGEWYGYLRRDGLPTMPSTKGSTFKGPFHMPRCMIMVDKTIDKILSGE